MKLKRKIFSRFNKVVKEATRLKSLNRHTEAHNLMDAYAKLVSAGSNRAISKAVKTNNPALAEKVVTGVNKVANHVDKTFDKLANTGVAKGYKDSIYKSSKNLKDFRDVSKSGNKLVLVGKVKALEPLEKLSATKKQVKKALSNGKKEIRSSSRK